MTATVRTKRALQRSRIIQRPRLLAMLDGSEAQVRMLVAAAGYGKTTLAEQWVNQEGRRHVWYTARTASADVAALALGVAHACSSVVDGCEVRLREHLRAMSAAGEHVSALAEILSEDLAAWPKDAWLVIDDYQEFAGAVEAEAFVADLVASCPVQLLITSRQRPAWVTARNLLYGDVFEVNQSALAMNNEEAAELLADWSLPSASGLVALANGWPAVISLASVSSAEIESDLPVPESLYQFFAEEVFDALGDEVCKGVSVLALAPVVDHELARELLGERSEVICDAAREVGILVERENRLELHPLARAFLEDQRSTNAGRPIIRTCLNRYRELKDWDAAFELVVRHDADPSEFEALIENALNDLLEQARLSTIEAWCDYAARRGLRKPYLLLARAEVSLRRERYAQATALAQMAAADKKLAFRALSLAGRAANLSSREEEALGLYRQAQEAANTAAELQEARWGQVICAIDLDLPEAPTLIEAAIADVDSSDPVAFVRATTCSLSFAVRSGSLELQDADVAWELLPMVGDPVIRTSFESIYANALALNARYRDALVVAKDLLETADRHRLEFGRAYGLVPAAMAYAGLRDWRSAHAYLDEADEAARKSNNDFAQLYAYAVRIRTLSQQGLHAKALALPSPSLEGTIPAMRTEVLASRALALVAGDRLDDAQRVLAEIQGRAVEAVVLREAVELAIPVKRGERVSATRVAAFEEVAFARGGIDLLVTSYRAIPELLLVLVRSAPSKRLFDLCHLVGDEDLLRPAAVAEDPKHQLTPREREVYELLAQSLTNRQIADLLVISEATAKLHSHRVLTKLGLRSRKALAVQAALERSHQATSATDDRSPDS